MLTIGGEREYIPYINSKHQEESKRATKQIQSLVTSSSKNMTQLQLIETTEDRRLRRSVITDIVVNVTTP